MLSFNKTILLACLLNTTSVSAQSSKQLVRQPFFKVKLMEGMWNSRLDILQETLLLYAFEKTEPAVENLRRTATVVKLIS